ncbi:hypothetical protein M7I_6271 [Glarea lozoyensis 74030]|uniref:Uncharacterized protein n=1 Tax=Glarea lozoyensis (strain ATCC 74030 / MF5533) TaxID=1104152 RepID=H0EU42_GLAL7|nr:hypothetical protein M7I_6271 [Glarea lozoyensis 74030]
MAMFLYPREREKLTIKKSAVPSATPFRNLSNVPNGTTSNGFSDFPNQPL